MHQLTCPALGGTCLSMRCETRRRGHALGLTRWPCGESPWRAGASPEAELAAALALELGLALALACMAGPCAEAGGWQGWFVPPPSSVSSMAGQIRKTASAANAAKAARAPAELKAGQAHGAPVYSPLGQDEPGVSAGCAWCWRLCAQDAMEHTSAAGACWSRPRSRHLGRPWAACARPWAVRGRCLRC